MKRKILAIALATLIFPVGMGSTALAMRGERPAFRADPGMMRNSMRMERGAESRLRSQDQVREHREMRFDPVGDQSASNEIQAQDRDRIGTGDRDRTGDRLRIHQDEPQSSN